jgi:heme exporter protein CcmB
VTYLRVVLLVFAKDFKEELRRKENLAASFFFAFLSLFMFYLAMPPSDRSAGSNAGVLWIIILFAGSLFMGNSFRKETETGTLQALLLAPVDRSALYLGKLLVNFTFLLILEALLLGLSALLLNLRFGKALPAVAGTWILITVGYASLGTLLAALVAHVRGGQVLYPILLFPFLFPLLVGAVILTGDALEGETQQVFHWLRLIALFDTVFLVAPLLLFEHAVEE